MEQKSKKVELMEKLDKIETDLFYLCMADRFTPLEEKEYQRLREEQRRIHFEIQKADK